MVLTLAGLSLGGAEPLPPLPENPDVLRWSGVGAWTFTVPAVPEAPLDVEATATFTHESGATVQAPLFHDGGTTWQVRFPALRTGAWRYRVRSELEALDGQVGAVRVEPGADGAHGFLRPRGNRLVVPTDDGRDERAVLYNVYMPSTEDLDHLSDLPLDPAARGERIEALLDEAAKHGFPALLVRVYNAWFRYDARGYDEHDHDTPDPRTFEVLEDVIRRAHARGMFVHVWAWGDESRKWTPVGVGGINGAADRRLQRYIAARLGPLPGWTMSYGFDLDEWVAPEQVRRWADTLHASAPVAPILMAREVNVADDVFQLGDDKLDVFSSDDRPEEDFYAVARERLAEGTPVLLERRFLHGRDGVWDADTTRRALWQFTMAGGAGAIWGPGFEDEGPYPSAGPFRAHARFWAERFTSELAPVSPMDGQAEDGVTLRAPDGTLVVTYREDADEVPLDLEGVPGERRAVAVDTRAEAYQEIEIGPLQGEAPTWEAPHASDWAVAVHAD